MWTNNKIKLNEIMRMNIKGITRVLPDERVEWE
jgi:hypothetical protein